MAQWGKPFSIFRHIFLNEQVKVTNSHIIIIIRKGYKNHRCGEIFLPNPLIYHNIYNILTLKFSLLLHKQYCDWNLLNVSLSHNPQCISSDSHWPSVTLNYILLTKTWKTHHNTMVLPFLAFSTCVIFKNHFHSTCSYWKWFFF